MVATNLETELHGGVSRFGMYGTVNIAPDTFPSEESVSASGYHYKRISFPVRSGEGNSVYVQMMGGYSEKDPKVFVRNKDGEFFNIKWDLRNNENMLENVEPQSFVRVSLEKDANGELIEKKFVSELDAINYMTEHLENGMDVYLGGNVEYRHYNGQVTRSFNVTRVLLNENNHEHVTRMRQTYLISENSVPRDWEDRLKEKGEVKINAFVPQYVSKEDGKEIKKTIAMPQTFTVKGEGDDLKKALFTVRKMIPAEGTVKEIPLNMDIIDGFRETTGEIEMTEEVRELIEAGLMTEDEVKTTATISSERVHDTVFYRFMFSKDQNGQLAINSKDRYAPSALLFLDNDDEDVSTGSDAFGLDEEDTKEDDLDAMFM